MIENLIKKLMKSATTDEILSYKSLALDLYDSLYAEMQSKSYCRTNFDDIKALLDLEFPMVAYYGFDFFEACGFPFIKEHNPGTIDVLELAVLFYTIQVMDLLENDFYSQVTLCIYETSPELFDHTEKINLIEYKHKNSLFSTLWFYFKQVVNIKDGEREFMIGRDSFYLTDEEYEEVLDMTYRSYAGSNYSHVIDRILGSYKTRFTKMEYILRYQSLFVKVGYEYLCTLANR